MEKYNLDEAAVIACYEQYESARPVTLTFGVSYQTVYRILAKNNVKRTHRHPEREKKHDENLKRPGNCNYKYCPAFVCMLRSVCNLRHKDICEVTGYTSSAVGNIITRHGLTDKRHCPDIDIDAIEREYLAGASTYELGDKYGVNHCTISKWMKKRGHVRGKGYAYPSRGTNKGLKKGHETRTRKAFARLKEKTETDSNGTIELISFYKSSGVFKCCICGSEFKKYDINKKQIYCPECRRKELDELRKRRECEKEQRAISRAFEYKKEKHCVSCGAVFHSECKTKKYCSDTCSRREKYRRDVAAGKTKLKSYGSHRKRARLHGVEYEHGITLKKLIERDGNICQICGKPCDENDLSWGYSGPFYPSIDHIIAIANGGSHTWDNVQLAHCICNSYKRDLDMDEVVAYA